MSPLNALRILILLLHLLILAPMRDAAAATEPLFDGKTLGGWEGDPKVFRVEQGVIVGGSFAGNPQNEFLTTKRRFKNFRLTLEYKLVGTEGFVNGGVQFRSERITDPQNEMKGYQADIGAGYSGCLYDESRRKTFLAKTSNLSAVSPPTGPASSAPHGSQLEKPGDWNLYEIRCEGNRIRIFLNGTLTVDYTESEPRIPQEGVIGLQIHGNCKAQICYRSISIETLPERLVPTQDEILSRFGDPNPPEAAAPGWGGKRFSLGGSECVVFIGQTNLVREQKNGELEARLTAGFLPNKPRFRSMAWEADTVYEQWRDLNFGAWQSQLEAVGASVVIAQFGQVEVFDGVERLPEFVAACHRLLDQFSVRTRRLVLLSPTPFERSPSAHGPDQRPRNDALRAYSKAIEKIAADRGALFVDLFSPLAERSRDGARLTDNGIHLNQEGLHVVAELVLKGLAVESRPVEDLPEMQAAIIEKNRLWMDCWRPANWSFVYGDRVTQRFGQAGGSQPPLHDSFENHKPLIAALDERIHSLAKGEASAPPRSSPLPLPAASEEAVLTPEQEKATFTVAEGFDVELVAAEPLGISKPTKMAWDERGRLWVACSPTYPQTIPGLKPSDYIVVLESSKGDGVFDKSSRFAEGLTMVQGIEPADGGLYVCDFDQILFLKDTTGSGKANSRNVVFSGFGIGDTHQLVNSITHGPDGTLWFSQGLHAFSRVETAWGPERLEKAGLWRFHPRTQRLDAFFNGGKAGHNCWGIAFDDFGQVFHKSGDRPEGYYSVPGLVKISNPDEYHPTGAMFASNPKTTTLDFIGTRGMPKELQGCVVIGGYFGNVIEVHRPSDDGAGFKSEQLPKLLKSSAKEFRPVDVNLGPDGAIYIADWLNPIIGHYQASYADPMRDRTHGRIWRIISKTSPRIKQPDLAGMTYAQLFDQLRSPERWTRRQAKRLLFAGTEAEVLKAADAWVAGLDPAAEDYEHLLLEISGVFEAHESPRPQLLKRLLSAHDSRVRAYGARVIGAWAASLKDPVSLLRKSLHDPEPRPRLEAVVSCSSVRTRAAAEAVLEVLDSPRDRFINYALAQVLRSLQPQWKPALANGSFQFSSAAHRDFMSGFSTKQPELAHPGKPIYEALCLNCHQADGKGLAGVYPPLSGSDWVTGPKSRLIRVVLHGLTGPLKVNGVEYGVSNAAPMPPMGLDDKQAADVLSYVRSQFGNHSPPVTPTDVKEVRSATASRTSFWTAMELQ
jgi:mono/diheme cytochrome c family protein/glucose/arabinose dehydrogenase